MTVLVLPDAIGVTYAIAGAELSPRLRAVLEALPLRPGLRVLELDEQPFDLVVAVRLGALDGRHPELEAATLERLRAATVPGASLYIDQGDPLKEIALH